MITPLPSAIATIAKPAMGNWFPASLSIRSNFGTAGGKHTVVDVSPVMKRAAPGLDNPVRQTLKSIICESDPSIGVIGWEIQQNGLKYGVCIKDNLNNDVFNIGVEIPHGQPYLHRSPTMSVAEKAHVVALIQQTMKDRQPDASRFLLWNFEQLERACSNPATGIVSAGAPNQRLLANAKLYKHFGLSFPDDSRPLEKPDTVLLALECSVGNRYMLIDCSRVFPVFLVGNANMPAGPLLCMERSEAAQTLELAKTLAKTEPDYRLDIVWKRLETAVARHGLTRTPAP